MPSRRHVLCGVGGLAAAGLAGCTRDDPAADVSPGDDLDTEWPQPGGTDRYDCYVADAVAPREEPVERWSAGTTMPVGRPIVADDRVLLLNYGGLYAYDVESGEEVWRIDDYDDDHDGPRPVTAPIVVDGTVYLGIQGPRGLLALDVADGEQLLYVELESTPRVPPVVGYDRERLVIGTGEGLVGVTVDGERIWRRETFGRVSALTSWGDRLYAGTEGGELVSYHDLFDPSGLWRRQLDGSVVQIAALDGSDVVALTFGGDLARRDDSSTGAARWEHDITGSNGFVVGSNTYGVGRDIASVNTRTGDRYWSVDEDLRAPPAGAGDTIYTGGEGFVAAYAMDGGRGVGGYRVGYDRWRHEVEGSVHEGLAVADGAVFAVASNEDGGTLYALE